MKCTIRRSILVVISLMLWVPTAKAQNPLTVGAVLYGARALVSDIKEGASEVIDKGDAALGMRMELLASQLELTLDRLEERFDKQRQNLVTDLRGIELQTFTDLSNLVHDTSTEFRSATGATVFDTQTAINQILDRLPFTKTWPLITGVAPRSVVQLTGSAIDAYILGFALQDPRLNNKLPKVVVDGVELASSQVGATQRGIQLSFTPELKQKIGIAPNGAFRRPVMIEVTAFRKEGWPFATTKSYRSQFFLDPGPPSFRVSGDIDYRGVQTSDWIKDKVATSVFTGRVKPRTAFSGPKKWENQLCTPSISGNIRGLKGKSWWTWDKNTGKPSGHSAGSPSVGGNKVCVRGWIEGADAPYGKGVYATLHLEATFERQVNTMIPSSAPLPETIVTKRKVSVAIDGSRGAAAAVRLSFSDAATGSEIDTLSMVIAPGTSDATATSKNGLFEFRLVGSSGVVTPLVSGINVGNQPH